MVNICHALTIAFNTIWTKLCTHWWSTFTAVFNVWFIRLCPRLTHLLAKGTLAANSRKELRPLPCISSPLESKLEMLLPCTAVTIQKWWWSSWQHSDSVLHVRCLMLWLWQVCGQWHHYLYSNPKFQCIEWFPIPEVKIIKLGIPAAYFWFDAIDASFCAYVLNAVFMRQTLALGYSCFWLLDLGSGYWHIDIIIS